MSEKKYTILPPTRTVIDQAGRRVTGVIPGYSMDEYQANRDKALEELLATFTPKEMAEYRQYLAGLKRKRKK